MAQRLTPQQIAQYAYNAGFRGQALNIAVAVALAESGGNPTAYNPESAAGTKPGSGSRGLWQIYGGAHPEYNNNNVYDPQANANAAYKVFVQAGNRFTPWSTYNQGLAKPQYDFSSMFRYASPATNQAAPQPSLNAQNIQTETSAAPSVSSWEQLLALPSTLPNTIQTNVAQGAQTAVTQTVKQLFPLSREDYIFIFSGYALVVLGLIFLLIAGLNSDAGKAAIGTAAKVAAL